MEESCSEVHRSVWWLRWNKSDIFELSTIGGGHCPAGLAILRYRMLHGYHNAYALFHSAQDTCLPSNHSVFAVQVEKNWKAFVLGPTLPWTRCQDLHASGCSSHQPAALLTWTRQQRLMVCEGITLAPTPWGNPAKAGTFSTKSFVSGARSTEVFWSLKLCLQTAWWKQKPKAHCGWHKTWWGWPWQTTSRWGWQ